MIPNHASHTRPLTFILWCFLARTPVNASLLSSEWRSFQEPKLRWSSTRSFYRAVQCESGNKCSNRYSTVECTCTCSGWGHSQGVIQGVIQGGISSPPPKFAFMYRTLAKIRPPFSAKSLGLLGDWAFNRKRRVFIRIYAHPRPQIEVYTLLYANSLYFNFNT